MSEKFVNHNQIIRKDGYNTILELSDSSFEIGKVLVNLQKYDPNKPQGQKVDSRIMIYLDFATVLRFANNLTNPNDLREAFKKAMDDAKKEEKQFYGIQLALGGSSAATLQKQNRQRPDGKAEYRTLTINLSNKPGHILLVAASGPAMTTKTGAFAPAGKPDSTVQMAITIENFAEIWLTAKAHIEAYLAYKYRNGIYQREVKAQSGAPVGAKTQVVAPQSEENLLFPEEAYTSVGVSSSIQAPVIDEDYSWDDIEI